MKSELTLDPSNPELMEPLAECAMGDEKLITVKAKMSGEGKFDVLSVENVDYSESDEGEEETKQENDMVGKESPVKKAAKSIEKGAQYPKGKPAAIHLIMGM